jgi:hypothetical protein
MPTGRTTLGPYSVTFDRLLEERDAAGYRKSQSVPCKVWLTLDEEGLARMLGEKAFKNKSRRSNEAGGLITAEVREIR